MLTDFRFDGLIGLMSGARDETHRADARGHNRGISELLAAAAADPTQPSAWESLTGSKTKPPEDQDS